MAVQTVPIKKVAMICVLCGKGSCGCWHVNSRDRQRKDNRK